MILSLYFICDAFVLMIGTPAILILHLTNSEHYLFCPCTRESLNVMYAFSLCARAIYRNKWPCIAGRFRSLTLGIVITLMTANANYSLFSVTTLTVKGFRLKPLF